MNPDRTARFLTFALLFLFAACIAPLAVAQYQTFPIQSDQLSLPAGANGATLSAKVTDSSPTLNFNVCFYTGSGSTAPIPPAQFTSSAGQAAFTYTVPASTIQQVPPVSFYKGYFAAYLYTVPTSITVCTGTAQALHNYARIILEFPVLTNLSLVSAPQINPKLAARLPANLTLTGTGFFSPSSASPAPQSIVIFSSNATVLGTVRYISPTSLVSTIPTTIDPYVDHVNVQVCTTAVYTYCSPLKRLNLNYLPVDDGVVTATPSIALPTDKVTVSATFGSSTPTLAGAPGGLVAFHYASTVLGSSRLILDPTGTLVPAPVTSLQTTSALAPPLIADFNQDGVPDILSFETGSPTLHLVLGSSPSGSFAADQPIVLSIPGLTILSVAVADLNHDGLPDIALLGHIAGATSNTLYTLLNDGSANFPAPVAYATPVYASNLLAADFNHDGLADIALAGALDSSGTTGLQVLLGDGTGHFTTGPVTSGLNATPSASFGGFQIAAADLNGDGFPEIIVLNGANAGGSQITKSITVFQNDGKANFSTTINVPTDGTAQNTFQIAPLTPGQLPDLIIANATGISVALNQSTTAVAFAATQSATAIPNLKQAVVGDFNSDGLLDVAVDDGTTIHVLTGDGQGAFAAKYPGLSIPSTPNTTLLAADLNLDTYADLVALTGSVANTSSLQAWITAGSASASLPAATFPVGVHSIQARTLGTFYLECASVNGSLTINPIVSTISVAASATASVNFGSAVTISATIPDATATGKVSFFNGTTLLGTAVLVDSTAAVATFATATLPAGNYAVTAVYAGDATHAGASSPLISFKILPIAPKLAWSNPPGIIGGTILSPAQLNATATGVTGAALPGTFTYTPAAGSIPAAGTQTLTTTFTPADINDYTTASASVSIVVTPFALASLSSDLALLGDGAKTITLTGTGFLPNAVAQMDGVAVPTTFVNATTLTAIVPASDFLKVHTVQVSIAETAGPSQNITSTTVPFYVVAPIASVVFGGPTSIVPGSQITLNFKLTNPYPVPLTATFTLGFTPVAGLTTDPNVLFTSGGNTYTVTIPANSTESPQVIIQVGTVAGAITVGLDLIAGGTDVTPASVKPLSIQAPLAVPGITSLSASLNGDNLTVTLRGFSNTRQIGSAAFHFTPVTGGSIGTPDVTIDVGSIFATWYADPASSQYGSEFTYTQVFNLTSDASVVGQVTVTLINSVGGSPEANSP